MIWACRFPTTETRSVGTPRGAADQRDVNGERRGSALAPAQGVGGVHQRGDPARRREDRSCGAPLWGKDARRKKSLPYPSRHTVIESPHPSPQAARRGFFGSKPFGGANHALLAAGREEIDWSLTE